MAATPAYEAAANGSDPTRQRLAEPKKRARTIETFTHRSCSATRRSAITAVAAFGAGERFHED
jgi:hypothetical protein